MDHVGENEIHAIVSCMNELYNTEKYSTETKYDINPTVFFDLAKRHQLITLLSDKHLSQLSSEQFAYALLQRKIAKESNRMSRYASFLAKLESNGIGYFVVKGCDLSYLAYGKTDVRVSKDLDLLVEKKQQQEFIQIAKEEGFEEGEYDWRTRSIQKFCREEELAFRIDEGKIMPMSKVLNKGIIPYISIDSRTNMTWNGYSPRVSSNFYLKEFRYAEHTGCRYRVPRLEMAFVCTCLHHYKHLCSVRIVKRSGIIMRYLSDIYFFLIRQKDMIDMDILIELISALAADDYIHFLLYHSTEVFGCSEYIESIMRRLKRGDDNILHRCGIANEHNYYWNIVFSELLTCKNPQSHMIRI